MVYLNNKLNALTVVRAQKQFLLNLEADSPKLSLGLMSGEKRKAELEADGIPDAKRTKADGSIDLVYCSFLRKGIQHLCRKLERKPEKSAASRLEEMAVSSSFFTPNPNPYRWVQTFAFSYNEEPETQGHMGMEVTELKHDEVDLYVISFQEVLTVDNVSAVRL